MDRTISTFAVLYTPVTCAPNPKDVATDTAQDLSALVGELAALRADAHHCPTDPKYTAPKHRLKDPHAAVEAAVVEAEGKDERGAVS